MTDDLILVVGQGYVGLPIAMRAVDVGFRVVGYDVDTVRIGRLQSGISYVEDVAGETVRAALDSGSYSAASSLEQVDRFDAAIITVPTPLSEATPDLSYIVQATREIGERLHRGALVVLESTTYPGTTADLVKHELEALSGLVCGEDFFLAYSPERIDPGNKRWDFVSTPKVVGADDPRSLSRVEELYAKLVHEVVVVSGTREAELTKLLENTFRHVNIALVNELAIFAHELGINIWEVIEAADTKPFGFMKFTPGPGVGGHCLPVDPSYLSWQVRRTLGKTFRFVELANDVNEHMPDYVVQRLMMGLNDRSKALRGSRILALGLAYKKNTGDPRESPAARVIDLLVGLGAEVVVVDPFVEPHLIPDGIGVSDLTLEAVQHADAAVILTDHDCFDWQLLKGSDLLVLDTRNRLGDPATAL